MKKIIQYNFILIVLIFNTYSCSDKIIMNNQKDGYYNILENDEIQSAAFNTFNKELYLGYIRRGAGKCILFIKNLSRNKSYQVDLEVNGAWQIIAYKKSFVLGGEDGNLYIVDIESRNINVVKSPFPYEKPIICITCSENTIYAGTYKHALIYGYNTTEKKITLANKNGYYPNEKYVRSIIFSKKNNSLYLGTGAKSAFLSSLDLENENIKIIFKGKEKGYNFVYALRLLENIEGKDYLFCRLRGNQSKNLIIYNITDKKLSKIMDEIDIGSISKGKNNEIFYSKSSILYSSKIKNNNLTEEKKIGEIDGGAISTIFHKDNLYLINGKANIISYDTISSKFYNYSKNKNSEKKQIYVKLNGLYLDDHSLLWTSGFKQGGNVLINTKTNEKQIFKGIDQTEITFRKGNNVYFGEYPEAKLYLYKINNRWKIPKNPSLITQIADQDRIVCAASSEKSNKVYFGTVPTYGKLGGEIISVDENNNTKRLKKFKNYSVASILIKDNILIIGTSISGGLGSCPKVKNGKVYFYDLNNDKMLHSIIPVKGEITISSLIELDKERIAGISGGTLFIYNLISKKIEKKIWVYKASSKTDLITDSDLNLFKNKIYLTGGKKAYCINLRTEKVHKLFDNATDLVFDKSNQVFYYLEGSHIRKYKLK